MRARSDHSALREIRPLVSLGVPTALSQFGTMLLGVVDTLMVGRLGVTELGAAALGTVWIFGTIILGIGVIFGMDPIIAQAHGARDHERVGVTLQQGVVTALIVSVPIALSWLVTEPVLLLLGQSPELAAGAHAYVVAQIPSIPVFMVYLSLRQYLQGRGVVMPAVWITVVANGFNALGNWVLIFGHLGFPAMGLVGAAIATAATRGSWPCWSWCWCCACTRSPGCRGAAAPWTSATSAASSSSAPRWACSTRSRAGPSRSPRSLPDD